MNANHLGTALVLVSAVAFAGLLGMAIPGPSTSPGAATVNPHAVTAPPPAIIARAPTPTCSLTVIVTAMPSVVHVGQPAEITVNVIPQGSNIAPCLGAYTYHYAVLPPGFVPHNAPVLMGATQIPGNYHILVVVTTPTVAGEGSTMLGVQA